MDDQASSINVFLGSLNLEGTEIALIENGTPFEFRCIGPDTPQHTAE